jgi:hypothetical protein
MCNDKNDSDIDEQIQKAENEFKKDYRARAARVLASASASMLSVASRFGIRHLLKRAFGKMADVVPEELGLYFLLFSKDRTVADSAQGYLDYLFAQRAYEIANKHAKEVAVAYDERDPMMGRAYRAHSEGKNASEAHPRKKECFNCDHCGMDMDMTPYCVHPKVAKDYRYGLNCNQALQMFCRKDQDLSLWEERKPTTR